MHDDNLDRLGERSRARFLQQDREALLDMEADPGESRNLIDDPARASVAAEMRAKVLAFRQTTRDPWLEASFSARRGTEPFGVTVGAPLATSTVIRCRVTRSMIPDAPPTALGSLRLRVVVTRVKGSGAPVLELKNSIHVFI